MQPTQTKQDKYIKRTLKDLRERERLLMQYGGIFRHNINEFAKMLPKLNKKRKNFSR